MRNADIDDALERAVPSPHAVQPELLKRIAETIRLTLVPVRPLPSGWTLSAGLVLILAAVALVGAARVGFQGFAALGLVSRAAIFGTLVVLACAAAGAMVAEWILSLIHI